MVLPVGAKRGQETLIRQLTTVVPQGVCPGETHLSVGCGDTHVLLVKVPLEALPGDKLLLSQGQDSSWTCSIVRQRSSDPRRQQLPQDHSDPLEKRITLLVPPRVAPGESKLAVSVGEGARVHLTVPAAAKPGDAIELRQELVGPGKGGLPADAWRCKLVCDKVARGEPREGLGHVSKLRPLHAPPACGDKVCADLFAAVRAAGGVVSSKLVRGSTPPLCIPGILAAEPIQAGEELCRIPNRLHISPDTARELTPELWRAATAQSEVPESRRHEAAQCVFLAQLLHGAEERAAGDGGSPPDATRRCWLSASDAHPDVRTVWERYADGLLNEDFASHPYRLAAASPDTMRESFEPSTEADYFIQMAHDVHTIYQVLTRACPSTISGQWPEFSMFFRARLCILTRVFQASCDSTLVPVVDLFNHASGADYGVSWRWNEHEQAMTATARRAHTAGEELFCSYGPRSNLLLYRTYGFTQSPDTEPAWTCTVWPDYVLAIYDMFLPAGESRVPIVLESKHMEDSLCEVLNQVRRNGRDATEFLRLICARCMWPYEHDPALKRGGRSSRRQTATSRWTSLLGSKCASTSVLLHMRTR
uniref:SET domain-containing protein n=1 Tax=Alexandrium monilatum TaxID=311494 RepID=A0A7S4Q3L5_9DINO